jgi:hypothetical protein
MKFDELSSHLNASQSMVHGPVTICGQVSGVGEHTTPVHTSFKHIDTGGCFYGIGRYPAVLMVKVNDHEALPLVVPGSSCPRELEGQRIEYKRNHLVNSATLMFPSGNAPITACDPSKAHLPPKDIKPKTKAKTKKAKDSGTGALVTPPTKSTSKTSKKVKASKLAKVPKTYVNRGPGPDIQLSASNPTA